MSYTQLTLPDNLASVVKDFVRNHLDMQFADIHCMLRLPIQTATLHSGLNFAAANSLLSLISGISALLTPEVNTIHQSGAKFIEALQRYYPWSTQPPGNKDSETIAKHLYQYFRNPLAHTLGLRRKGNFLVRIVKTSLSEEEIERLEESESPPYPAIEYSPVEINGEQIEAIDLHIPSLYWCVRKMFNLLMCDNTQMEKTANSLRAIGLR